MRAAVPLCMTRFRAIERESAELTCPGCGACAMSVHLRCDLSDRECAAVAACGLCGRRFEAAVLPTYAQRYEGMVQLASHDPCPRCGAHKRRVRALCDRQARECFFLLECSWCGEVSAA